MRPSGLEPPPGKPRTRPSTLRVYQFRHRRSEASIASGLSRAEAAALAYVHRRRYSGEHTFVLFPSSKIGGRAAMDLTKRQQEVFDFIRKYSAKYGYPPTVRHIA